MSKLGSILISFFFLVAISVSSQASDNRALLPVNNSEGEHRIALVIGNSAYTSSPLKNPVNDAKDVATKLRGLGFIVIERNNLQTKQIGGTLREFRSKLTPGAVALVFYAGHGLQIKGDNYLPAVDAEINSEEDVPNQSLAVRQIMDVLDDAKTRLNLVFLDACRNNPYARSFRSADRGLARISAPSGTLISYATRPGSVAADGNGRNGLYTSKLLAQMDSNQQIELTLKRLVTDVKVASQGKQEPWMEGSIEGDFCFAGCATSGSDTQVVRPVPAPVRVKGHEEIEQETWESARDSANIGAIQEYLNQYPKGRFTRQAKVLIATLKTTAEPTAAPAREYGEIALWAEVQNSNSKDDYDAYLAQYPNGIYAALARNRISKLQDAATREQELWQQAEAGDSVQIVQAYLDHYPNGSHAEAGREKLALLRKAEEMKPGRVFRDCPDCPEMIIVPAGSFDMGGASRDEKPVHRVTIGDFAMGKTEVTQGQWKAIMGNNPSNFPRCGDTCPVEKVSWQDAKEFIQVLNAKTGKQYRLPSEAEWEYACRAGGRQRYCGSENVDSVAWYNGNSSGTTHPVGRKQPNAFGLYDMSGNVFELVEDNNHDNYNGAPTDGSSWHGNDSNLVIRGGSWNHDEFYSRSAARWANGPSYRYYGIGFRLVRMLQ